MVDEIRKKKGKRPLYLRLSEELYSYVEEKGKLSYETPQKYIERLIELDKSGVDLQEIEKPRMGAFARQVAQQLFPMINGHLIKQDEDFLDFRSRQSAAFTGLLDAIKTGPKK